MPGSSAPSSSIPTAGCRKPAASCGATAPRGTSGATTIPIGPSTTTCARPTTAPARASPFPRRCSASSAASTRATRPPTTRTPISRSPCAPPAARSTTSRVATIVHFEGQTSGTDDVAGVKRHQVVNQDDVRRQVGGRARRASRRTASIPSSSATAGRSGACWSIDACMLTPDHDSGSVRMHGDARDPHARSAARSRSSPTTSSTASPTWRSCSSAASRCCSTRTCARSPSSCPSAGASSTSSCMSRHYVAVKHVDAVRAFAPQALVVFDTVDLHFLRTERQAELEGNALARAAARAKRDEELTLIRKADVTLVVSTVRADAARASSRRRHACSCCPPSTSRMRRRQAVRRARGPRVHRRLPASAEHRRACFGTRSEVLPRVRDALAGREDLHRRQQGAGERARAGRGGLRRDGLRPGRHAVFHAAAGCRSRRCATAPASRARSTSR